MPSHKPPSSLLDLTSIPFPSNKLTLGTVRAFLAENRPGLSAFGDFLQQAIVSREHKLAEKAFARAVGKSDPHPDWERDTLVDGLTYPYVALGLATGTSATEQLVRNIERAAERQAKAILGRGM